MILSHQSIIDNVKSGKIGIDSFIEDNVGPASYDLRLGNSFVEVTPNFETVEGVVPETKKVMIRTMNEEYPSSHITVKEGNSLVIPPHTFVLATTMEYIEVPSNIAVYVQGRSSIGRMGLQVQNAGFVDPGFKGQITLELFNASNVPIGITPGRRVCQCVFHLLDEPTDSPYKGKYVGQVGATSSRVEEDKEVKDYYSLRVLE